MEDTIKGTGDVQSESNKKDSAHDIFKNKIRISLVGSLCGFCLGAFFAKNNDSRILASITFALVGYELGNIVSDCYQLHKID